MMVRKAVLSGAAVVAALAAGPAQAGYKVYNPYSASQNSYNQVKIRRLVVFGDSYSDPTWQTQDIWNEQLVGSGAAKFQTNYAIAGATAFNGPTASFPTNSLRMQVDKFLGAGISYAPQDVTVVYIGYNDINRIDGLGKSKDEFLKNVDRLRVKGATNQNRRMLLVMEHNMLRDPTKSSRAQWNLPTWNQHVASVANARSNVIAVDLYTAFERIYANPKRYGFKNVTTPDPKRSAIDALYYDTRHLGQRGHHLIEQVFRHYLSRGWDWANTLKTGSQTIAALNSDLNNDLVFDTYNLTGDIDAAFQLVPFGELAAPGELEQASVDAGPVMGFAPERAGSADGGLALSWRLGEQTRLAFVLGSYDTGTDGDTAVGTSETDAHSRASGVVLDHRIGSLSLRSTLLYSDDRYETSSYDGFVGDSVNAGFGGSTLRVGQRLGWDIDSGPLTLTPWAALSFQRQDTDSFSVADTYVSDLTYKSSPVSETSASLGISLGWEPIELGDSGWLRLRADLGYTHGLAADDYEVSIREAAVRGYTQRETIGNEPDRSIDLGFGASWDAAPGLALSAGYRLDAPLRQDDGQEREHRLTAGLSWRF